MRTKTLVLTISVGLGCAARRNPPLMATGVNVSAATQGSSVTQVRMITGTVCLSSKMMRLKIYVLTEDLSSKVVKMCRSMKIFKNAMLQVLL